MYFNLFLKKINVLFLSRVVNCNFSNNIKFELNVYFECDRYCKFFFLVIGGGG